MSRSKRKTKGPGYDYWSRRYGNDSMCNSPGGRGHSNTKRITNRAERRIGRVAVHKLKKET